MYVGHVFKAVALAIARGSHTARTEWAATSVSRVCELTCVTVVALVFLSRALCHAIAVQVLSERGEVVHRTVVHVDAPPRRFRLIRHLVFRVERVVKLESKDMRFLQHTQKDNCQRRSIVKECRLFV
jgi:hypothetical protein